MSDNNDNVFVGIISAAVVLVVAVLGGVILRTCQIDQDTFTRCVEATNRPLECRASTRR